MARTAQMIVGRLLLARSVLACGALAFAAPQCRSQEQYPKPLIHTPQSHPAAHVLLLSVDGLHAADLAGWVVAHPDSSLAALSGRGVTYTNAHTPMANETAGLLALTTGGTPISTGIVSADGYDRTLSSPESDCKTAGAELALENGFRADGGFNPAMAPRNPRDACRPMRPHDLLRVNTIFEVVHEKIGPTAWAGEDWATTDLLRGPSGKGLDQACVYEQSSAAVGDQQRVAAVRHWIDGKDCAGSSAAAVPVLFGMTFASVAAAQTSGGTGYVDLAGTPSRGLTESFAFIDRAVGELVAELKAAHLYDSTWIVVSAPYGGSPVGPRAPTRISVRRIQQAVNAMQPELAAHITGGDVAAIWLRDRSKTDLVTRGLNAHAAALGIQAIYAGERLALTLNSSAQDPRMPDILLQPETGVTWPRADAGSHTANGGTLDADTHVAMLVSGAQLTGRRDPTYVPTTQLGPLLLRALGMEKFDLQALHLEHSPALPGVF